MKSFEDILMAVVYKNDTLHRSIEQIHDHYLISKNTPIVRDMTEAAIEYAKSKCNEQRNICAAAYLGFGQDENIQKEAISNAPNPEFT